MADDKLVKYVKKSSYRLKVLKTLGNDAKMPKEIANDSGILPNHISNVLRQLKDKEIVECINPEVRKGRLYRLSDNGLDVLEELE
ncbi:transcriptional regulator [uncultured Methanobrevibacter sp.]|uniref:transcriptional regulator n=1 Tax=uncultured Methanobrevibacter sp. TaxID=253161 RepID=UPI00345DEF8D